VVKRDEKEGGETSYVASGGGSFSIMEAVEAVEWVDGVLESVVAAGPLEIWREADNLRDFGGDGRSEVLSATQLDRKSSIDGLNA
jgi:hypothetical protein